MNNTQALRDLPYSLDTLRAFVASIAKIAVAIAETSEHRPTVIMGSLSDEQAANGPRA